MKILLRESKKIWDIWSRTTIYKNIPNEFKSEEKREAGRQSHKNVLEQSATETGPEIEASSTGGQSVNEKGRK